MNNFCPCCDSLLTINLQNTLFLFCKSCSYQKEFSYLTEKIEIKSEIHEKIIWQKDIQKNLSKTEKICEKCNFNEASFFEMQTRSADEPMTIFYCCVRCKHTWKE